VVRPRIERDHYATPAWAVERILPVLRSAHDLAPVECVLDPACGDGAILDVARAQGLATVGLEVDAARAAAARAKGHHVTVCDALGSTWDAAPHTIHAAIVGNPPYSLALAFAERTATWSRNWSRPAALLMRLGFLASQKRAAFHAAYPSDVYVLSRRPAFRADTQGTDSSDYAWLVWGLGGGRWQVLA
jgi:hypothetical protein